MSTNCLVTKLKSVVDNQQLPKLGEIRLILLNNKNNTVYITFGPNVPYTDVYGDNIDHIVDAPGSNGWFTIYFKDASAPKIINIKNKYNVSVIRGGFEIYNGSWSDYKNLSSLTYISFENNPILTSLVQFSEIPTLTGIEIKSSIINEDISILLPYFRETLSVLYIYGNITGNLQTLGKFKVMNRIQNTLGSLLSGDLVDFVAVQRGIGNTEKSVRTDYVNANGAIKFNGSPAANVATSTLSWTANTITYNNETIDNSEIITE